MSTSYSLAQCQAFPQDGGQRLTPEEAERVDMVPNFSLNNAHFFCETADVSRGFPSARPAAQPSWEFVWNRWLATPLRQAALPGHCPHLLQARIGCFLHD